VFGFIYGYPMMTDWMWVQVNEVPYIRYQAILADVA
jgi:hypothetical protein